MDDNENNNYLSLSKLNCTIEDFTPDILNLVKAKKKGELYRKFAQKFLTYLRDLLRLSFRSLNTLLKIHQLLLKVKVKALLKPSFTTFLLNFLIALNEPLFCQSP